MIQIAIIGLGEIGTSLGLALKYQKDEIYRVGMDVHKYATDNASEKGAVDRVSRNLLDAVKEADIVFLAIPAHEVEDTLELIGHELKKDAAVLDTCPTKSAAINWAKKSMSQPDHFLGIYPSINPAYLSEPSNEFHSAHEDLFQSGTLYLAPSTDTEPAVVKLASDLGTLIGAHSAFIDPAELDGLLAAAYDLPLLLSNALMSTLLNQNSWEDCRKLAVKEFVQETDFCAFPYTGKEFTEILSENRENTLRILNDFIVNLKTYRDAIQNRDRAALSSLYEKAEKGREKWLKDYEEGAWRKEKDQKLNVPTAGEMMGQMFLGGLGRKKKE
ncbi:MAG TPA: prephenate dehydrogenase/arogenate dehydrogenase family protein [Flexilinea sp.]|jgi:prephenate dehydrogenase|nr:prephenate dehydrogenase/arogenate dehydrogenase family protein [Flexilinea sp.]